MQNQQNPADSTTTELRSPHCDTLGSDCIGSDLMSLLGPNVNRVLMEFIWSSAEGSRLSLQKSLHGFTAQVTGAVHRSEGEAIIDRNQLRNLKRYLDSA